MIATELELTHLHEEMPAVSSGMANYEKELFKVFHVITVSLGAVSLRELLLYLASQTRWVCLMMWSHDQVGVSHDVIT